MIFKSIKIFAIIFCGVLFASNIPAQSKILAALDFDPKVDGFAFKNYTNDKYKWDDDIGAEDLIRMFGARGACKSGDNAKNCVLKEAAAQWMKEYLEAMKIGHCEGIAVAGLRMKSHLAFKKKTAPTDFQPNVKTPFAMQFEQSIQNYIAYYWITQTFDEVVEPTQETAERGPVEIAKMLIAAMENGKETYLMSFKKFDNGRIFDGHAVTPLAVEDAGDKYDIHVYDNNYPGETRHLFIFKNTNQQWTYNASANLSAKPDYVGDKTTLTLDLTATSWRDGKCFRASFVKESERKGTCGVETASLVNSFLTNASYKTPSVIDDQTGEDAEFFLTGEGEMLVTDGNGDRIGYDPQTNRRYDEIPDGVSQLLIGGLGIDLPHFTFPYEESEQPYKIVFSGKYLDKESVLDFVFSAPGFTVGFNDIRLDPKETLTATISSDGEEISFTSSADGETPEVFYAFDPNDDSRTSYLTLIEGVELSAGKQLFYNFDFEEGKLFFSDNDGNEDSYDIELVRVNADGTRQTYTHRNLDLGRTDKYEMDFGDWKGKGDICFKEDGNGDGFDDEQCTEEADDNTDSEFDN